MKLLFNIKSHHYILMAFLLLHAFGTIIYVQHQPLTNDEADYIEYSKRWLKGHPEKVLDVDDSKTPVTAIAWIPRIVQQIIYPGFKQNDWGRSDQMNGRYMMILFFWLLFLYVYKWSKQLYGIKGYWLPVILLLIDPLVMAFTPVVTSDVACAFVLTAVFYHYYRFVSTKKMLHFIAVSFFSGLAFVTKSSLIFIPFILLFIFFIRLFANQTSINLKRFRYTFIYVVICWFVVNIGYQFQNSFQTWGSIDFKSQFFQSLMSAMPFLQNVPALLPEPFIRGFDLLQYHKEVGPVIADLPYKGVFILNTKFDNGVWWYYFVTAFFKIPIGTLLLWWLTVFVFIKQFNWKQFTAKYSFLLMPILVYGFLLSFVNPFQQGIRHAMILFPFMMIGSGYVWKYAQQYFAALKKIVIVLVLYSFISAASFFPDIMPYSNEFVMNKTKLFHYLAEYNYRHGDIIRDTKPFIDTHPDYRLASSTPQNGKFIVPGAFVFNTTYEVHQQYKWLKEYKPVGHYRYVFLLYDIK